MFYQLKSFSEVAQRWEIHSVWGARRELLAMPLLRVTWCGCCGSRGAAGPARAAPAAAPLGASLMRGRGREEPLPPSLPFCPRHGRLKAAKQVKLMASRAEMAAAVWRRADFGHVVPAVRLLPAPGWRQPLPVSAGVPPCPRPYGRSRRSDGSPRPHGFGCSWRRDGPRWPLHHLSERQKEEELSSLFSF